jgi:hypothetical protein
VAHGSNGPGMQPSQHWSPPERPLRSAPIDERLTVWATVAFCFEVAAHAQHVIETTCERTVNTI